MTGQAKKNPSDSINPGSGMGGFIFLAGVILLVLLIAMSRGPSQSESTDSQSASATTGGEQQTTTGGLPKLVDLGSLSCVPCKMMEPELEALRNEYGDKLIVEFIDVYKDHAATRQYGIRSIPTQVFLDPSGKELFRHVGYMSKIDILNKWRELGYDFTSR